MSSTTSSTEERALTLLGQGISAEMVATTLGVSPSRISQLLSDEHFSSKVSALRFENLAAHTERDNKYDKMEDALQDKLAEAIPYMMKSGEILKAIQVVNLAKRRGSSTPEALTNKNQVIQLVLPAQVTQIFTAPEAALVLDANRQVVSAGGQSLVTIQSKNVEKLLGNANASTPKNLPAPTNGQSNPV